MIKRNYLYLLDIFLTASLVIIFTLQPYFFHGVIDLGELGVYLPFINEVFNHKIIFKELMTLRGPLEIYAPAFLMSLFGKHINVLTAWFYFGSVTTIISCVFLARELLRARFFLYLLIPLLVANTFSLVYYKNWGGFRFACGLISIFLALKFFKKEKSAWLFFSGFFTAVGYLFSTEMGIFPFFAISLTLFIFAPKEKLLRNLSSYISGIALILAPFLLYLLLSGAFVSYLQNIIAVPRSAYTIYHHEILFPDMPHNPVEALKGIIRPFKADFLYALPIFIYLFLFLGIIRKYLKNKTDNRVMPLFCAGLYGIFMYFGSFRQINGAQFNIALQPALIFLILILENYFISFKERQLVKNAGGGHIFIGIFLFLTLFSLALSSVFTVKNNLTYAFDKERVIFRQNCRGCFPSGVIAKPLTIERGKGVLVPDEQADEINSVVKYIQDKTLAHEYVFTFPDQGAYNFLFNRPGPTRFCMIDMASYRPDWSEEFFSDLKTRNPRYVVLRRQIDSFESLIADYPLAKNRAQIRNFIQQNYRIEASFGKIDIFGQKNIKDEE